MLLLQFHLLVSADPCAKTTEICPCVFVRQYAVHGRILHPFRPISTPQTHLQQGTIALLSRLLLLTGPDHLLCCRSTKDAAYYCLCRHPDWRASDIPRSLFPRRNNNLTVRRKHASTWRRFFAANMTVDFRCSEKTKGIHIHRVLDSSGDCRPDRAVLVRYDIDKHDSRQNVDGLKRLHVQALFIGVESEIRSW